MTDNERLFRIVWPDRCWHIPGDPDEQDGWKGMRWCRICKAICSTLPQEQVNPDFAHSDEIAQAMMDAGLWDEFILSDHPVVITGTIGEDAWEGFEVDSSSVLQFANLIVNPEKLKQAIIAWWEGK